MAAGAFGLSAAGMDAFPVGCALCDGEETWEGVCAAATADFAPPAAAATAFEQSDRTRPRRGAAPAMRHASKSLSLSLSLSLTLST